MKSKGKYTQLLAMLLFGIVIFVSEAYAAQPLYVVVKGIEGEALKNTRQRILRLTWEKKPPISHQDAVRYALRIKNEIKLALAPYGYFNPRILYQVRREKGCWVGTFYVFLGPPTRIYQIMMTVKGPGKDNAAIQAYVRDFPLKVHDVFQAENYNEAKAKLFNITRNQGYINASFNNEIEINRQRQIAKVRIQLQTGPRYYFGKTIFTKKPYSICFLKRFIAFSPDTPFSNDKLIRFQQELEDGPYFRQVIITPDFEKVENYRVPLYLAPELPVLKKYSLGIGYGTLTGPRVTGGIRLLRLTEDGHYFEGDLKLSRILSQVTANYYIPGWHPLTEQWILGATYKRFEPKSGRSDAVTLSAGYMKKIEKLQIKTALNFLTDNFKIKGETARTSHLLYPNLILTYLDADNLINPERAFYANLQLQGGLQYLLSTTSFIQSRLKMKYLFMPFKFSQIILRGELGFTGVHDLAAFPFSMRFFAGGINSIRGFADSSIGPGKYLQIASIEYQHRITEHISAGIFYDLGRASNHLGEPPVNRGRGVGLVYHSPVGPGKLYLAQAVSKRTRPLSVEFSLGPEFS